MPGLAKQCRARHAHKEIDACHRLQRNRWACGLFLPSLAGGYQANFPPTLPRLYGWWTRKNSESSSHRHSRAGGIHNPV